ncbi:hypothetical protein SAMN05216233_101371 [Desulfoluna spongiiphila]|uniref:Uncharacterized protein n=1 Tax=Desulfoluna spongiiphila TaxID=419481 RepID=A0A1G5AQA9_9BACT|nr:hypothetical protein SAMN05216233_101371 [Desulfoluna spongiiphila]VVS91932.1 hypothetical protein DBB_15000 [Desulfoluna spongiiphila]
MRQSVGVVCSFFKDLLRAEDSRLIKPELHCSWTGTGWGEACKTVVWYGLAVAGVMLVARL